MISYYNAEQSFGPEAGKRHPSIVICCVTFHSSALMSTRRSKRQSKLWIRQLSDV